MRNNRSTGLAPDAGSLKHYGLCLIPFIAFRNMKLDLLYAPEKDLSTAIRIFFLLSECFFRRFAREVNHHDAVSGVFLLFLRNLCEHFADH